MATSAEAVMHALLKDQATSLADTIERLPDTRERSLAITKLEEAVMWAVKGLTG